MELEVVLSISGEVKPELLSTWMWYEVAPLTDAQSKAGVVSYVVLPLAGVVRLGAEGLDETAKVQVEDQGPVQQGLEPWTRQK